MPRSSGGFEPVVLLIVERQREEEGAAVALAAFGPNIAAVARDELAAKVQPKPKPLAAALAPARIATEQPAQLIVGNTGAVILNRDQHDPRALVGVRAL